MGREQVLLIHPIDLFLEKRNVMLIFRLSMATSDISMIREVSLV